MKYYPFGWTRYNSGGQKTTYRFTGQRYGPGGGGLYDYGARWYDSYLNTRTAGVKVRQILAFHKVSLTTSLISAAGRNRDGPGRFQASTRAPVK